MRSVVIEKNVTTDIQHVYTCYNYMLICILIQLAFDESDEGVPSVGLSALARSRDSIKLTEETYKWVNE